MKHTSQTKDRVHKDADRDFFMSAKEAVDYGLIDEVLVRHVEHVQPAEVVQQEA